MYRYVAWPVATAHSKTTVDRREVVKSGQKATGYFNCIDTQCLEMVLASRHATAGVPSPCIYPLVLFLLKPLNKTVQRTDFIICLLAEYLVQPCDHKFRILKYLKLIFYAKSKTEYHITTKCSTLHFLACLPSIIY